MNQTQKNGTRRLFLTVLLGELLVAALTVGVYLLIGRYSYRVAAGALLGTAVTLANLLLLILSTSRAVDRAMAARGTGEMSEEEIERFTRENQAGITAAVKLSFLIRTLTMLGALILAFLLDHFDVIATLIPLLALRPLLMLQELIDRRKTQK